MRPVNLLPRFAFLLSAALYATQAAAHPVVDAILKHYGTENLKQVKEIRFTYKGTVLGMGPAHTWIWRPQSDSVTFVDDGVSYSRRNMDPKFKSIDRKFVNDQYWFAFPIHLAFDKGIQVTVDSGMVPSPIHKEMLHRVVVTYMQKEGYTPNDAYELFATPEGEIREWVYHRHGNMKHGLKWTWEKQETFGGLRFAQEHKGSAHIRISGIEVK